MYILLRNYMQLRCIKITNRILPIYWPIFLIVSSFGIKLVSLANLLQRAFEFCAQAAMTFSFASNQSHNNLSDPKRWDMVDIRLKTLELISTSSPFFSDLAKHKQNLVTISKITWQIYVYILQTFSYSFGVGNLFGIYTVRMISRQFSLFRSFNKNWNILNLEKYSWENSLKRSSCVIPY